MATFLKVKLQKEEKNTAANLPKLTQKWRTVHRQTLGAERCREIEIVRQSFERLLDHKDSVVKRLVGDLNEAEQRFGQALHAHLHCVDCLLALQASRLPFFQQQWHNNLQELGAEFNTEREHISSLHQHDCTHQENLTFVKEQRRSELDTETQQNYEINIAETKKKHIGEMYALKDDMECVRKVRKVHKGHLPPGDDQRIASNALLSNEQCRAHKLDKEIKELQKKSISALRLKPKSSQELTQRTRQLKTQFDRASALDRKRLTTLTVESSHAAKQLQGIVSKLIGSEVFDGDLVKGLPGAGLCGVDHSRGRCWDRFQDQWGRGQVQDHLQRSLGLDPAADVGSHLFNNNKNNNNHSNYNTLLITVK
ncbi:hypothetical protein CRUP_035677 [Coryphaenoides rupestris]|nr:hypothetical protein CRUP_035677 [Coryphaenoides rupestris]